MAQAFHYYTQMAPTSYMINVTIDDTVLHRTLKAKEYRFIPVYLDLVTRAIYKQEELRIAVKNGVVGHYKTLTPAYPQFHEDDKTTSLLWTEYDEYLKTFEVAALMLSSEYRPKFP
ncbi:CatA-like O-acetyltransferase [Rubeoparvulum massiliense]|uniref:CatA-like O-acetyltransferase n=1 Tax=Rubeoparvulum massiliense TaxID=1631346 RepID=UPI00069F0E17|nr:CatA-like O-acetyltransferase [Rubeoparvulum massiliense]